MAEVPTVRVVCPDVAAGYIIINEADFDPAVHERFEASSAKPGTSGDPPKPPAEKSLHERTVAEVSVLIDAAATLAELEALAALETTHPKYEGGRTGVMTRIAERRATLAAPTE